MNKWTTTVLVLMFAVAVGRWQLLVASAVVLVVGEWQEAKEAKRIQAQAERIQTQAERAEYHDYKDGYELGWVEASIEENSKFTKVKPEPAERMSAVQMAARHWASKAGRANWTGYHQGFANYWETLKRRIDANPDAQESDNARAANNEQRGTLKQAWNEYKS